MSYLTRDQRRKRKSPVPRLNFSDATKTIGSYNLSEAAFEPIPDDHPLVHRRRAVQRFLSNRAIGSSTLRPRFNVSTQELSAQQPKRALTHTNSCFNGVDVVDSYFPDKVRNSAFLRVPSIRTRPLWTGNQAKASHSHRYNYQCPSLNDKEPPLSYLAEKIVEDGSEDRLLKQKNWCANTSLMSVFAAKEKEPDYRILNKSVNESYLKSYSSPYQNAVERHEEERRLKRMLRYEDEQQSMSMHNRPGGPKVFKISNIDEWWGLDPVKVSEDQVTTKKVIQSNADEIERIRNATA